MVNWQGTYPTGLRTAPISFAGLEAIGKAASELRLKEIEQKGERISENYKKVLKATSMSAMPQLTGKIREKYQDKISDYRKKVVDMYRQSQGELTGKQQLEIENGYNDLMQEQLMQVSQVKEWNEAMGKMNEPNFDFYRDRNLYKQIGADIYDKMLKGEYEGNVTADFSRALKLPTTAKYISEVYGEDVKNTLDTIVEAGYDGNVFKRVEMRGTDLPEGYEDSVRKAMDFRDKVLADPFVRGQYESNGMRDEAKYDQKKQEIEDYINSRVEEAQKGYASRRGGVDSTESFYIDKTPYKEEVKGDSGSFGVNVAGSIPLTRISSFYHNNQRVIPERIVMMPVAKDKDEFKKKLRDYDTERFSKHVDGAITTTPVTDEMIIGSDFEDIAGNNLKRTPFIKVIVPKEAVPEWATTDWVRQSNVKTEVKYVPYDSDMGSQLYSKMTEKQRRGFDISMEQLKSEFSSGESNESKTPEFTRDYLKSLGYTDKQINDGVKAGKIKLK